MIDFDCHPLLYLGRGLAKLETVQEGVGIIFVSFNIQEARQFIWEFATDRQHKAMFPDTIDALNAIIGHINTILRTPNVVEVNVEANRVVQPEEAAELEKAIGAAYTTFASETKRTYLAGLHHQRGYAPNILLEKMSELFSVDCWHRLSQFTKREVQESGRCLAFERYTAAAFHILRAVEAEVRDYVCLLTHAEPKRRDFAALIEVLSEHRADDKLLATLKDIRRLDRNPLAHPEAWLDLDEAIGTFNTARTALT